MTKKEFEKLYFSITTSELGKMIGVSRQTINNYAKKLGLRKGSGFSKKRIYSVDLEG